MVIFDCNGVLVDSEPIASAVLAQAFARAGFPLSADFVARRFHGRRPADIFDAVEAATGKKLPPAFGSVVTVETLRRFRTELRALPHAAHALAWIRGPKAVASSSPLDRMRVSHDVAAASSPHSFAICGATAETPNHSDMAKRTAVEISSRDRVRDTGMREIKD